jgi:hypothetical protein
MAIKIVKNFKLALAMFMSMVIAGSSCTAATVTTSYQSSSEDFPNPERGFSVGYYSENVGAPLPLYYTQSSRSNNITLIHAIYNMSNYRNSDLPQSFLDLVAKNCETARKGGVKLFIRFTYSQGQNQPDAPKNIILRHLDQLKPILQANYDAIAFMDAGFIGAWGEWHHSSNSLNNIQDKKTILFKLLSVLPSTRIVALRYLRDKMAIFENTNPLTPQEAFNGSYRARTGAHNDCLVANADDWGTYRLSSGLSDSNVVESQKNFLNLDNRYVVQGGETCQPSVYDDCPNVLKELERMRWSQLNGVADKTVLQGWKDQGCMEQIKRRLGYRFRLISSMIPDRVKPAGTFSMSFNVTNDGWASPYNPRSLEVILRNTQTGKEYYLPVAEAVRMWMPGATKTVNIVGGIPANMPPGEYRVFLNLPDRTPRLYGRPEYSIRLANQDVWEPPTGYNSLLRRVIVDPNAGGDTYSGAQFFKSR